MTPKQQEKETKVKALFDAAGDRVEGITRKHPVGTYVFTEDLERVAK